MDEVQDAFVSAVDYYASYRTGYPLDRLDELAAELGLDPTRRLLDIGCGPGQVSIPMARHCQTVTAIDPVPAMLEHGRAAALAAGIETITWLVGSSRDLAGLVSPGAQAAVFAASFHWTDRADVTRALDGLLAPGGAIAVITDVLDDGDLPDWDHAISNIRAGYLGETPPHLDAHFNPTRTDRETFAESAFSAVRTQTWSWERTLTVEQVAGLQLSYSFSSPALLGDRLEDFTGDVRNAVLELHPSGVVTERFRHEVLIATRPA